MNQCSEIWYLLLLNAIFLPHCINTLTLHPFIMLLHILPWRYGSSLIRLWIIPLGIFKLFLIFPWLFLRRFTIKWLHSLCLTGPRVVYLASFIFICKFIITTFCLCLDILQVCLLLKYDKVVIRRLPMYRLLLSTGWHWSEFREHPTEYSLFTLRIQTMTEKSILNLMWHANKTST